MARLRWVILNESAKGIAPRKVQKPVVCRGEVTEEALARCVELGSTIAEGVNAGIS